LLELRKQYATFGGPAVSHHQWSREFIDREVPLVSFRGDCAFLWQRRENTPANYVLSAYHILASDYAWLLSKLSEDGMFGAEIVPVDGELKVSRDQIDSILEIAYLDKVLKLSDGTQKTILDIGAGYGRLGHRLTQAFPNVKVLCTDAVPESTFICEYYLTFRGAPPRAQTVPLHELPSALEQMRVDLAVNICSFSECTIKAIEWWLDILRKHSVRFLLIVPDALTNGGTKLLSWEPGGIYRDFLSLVEAREYQRIALIPKYDNPELQRYGGISPTHCHLFELRNDGKRNPQPV
jgi:SAM-dependent methyltransferase